MFVIVEIVKYGGNILEVIEGIFCQNLENIPYAEFFTDIFEKRICSNHKENICFTI